MKENYRYSNFASHYNGIHPLQVMRRYVEFISKKINAGIQYDEDTMKDYIRYSNLTKIN
jgi:hypothetical protein